MKDCPTWAYNAQTVDLTFDSLRLWGTGRQTRLAIELCLEAEGGPEDPLEFVGI